MDNLKAFRRKSAFSSDEKRRSVSWKINPINATKHAKNNADKTDIDNCTNGDGDNKISTEVDGDINKKAGDDKKDKVKDAGSDLKEIGLWYGGSLVINTLVGPGIFGTPKGVLAGVGSVGMSMLIWTFSGIFSMCAALCFAELRESIRREGVEYAYITEAFGPLAGFVYTWMRIAAAEPTATAVFALAFSDYVTDSIYDGCGPPRSISITVATLGILTMVLVNLMSVKLSERMQNLASVGKTCALSVIIIMGVIRMVNGKVQVINEGFKGTKWDANGLAFACYNGLWSYGGWTNVNNVTSGIKKPPRNVPRVVKTIIPLVLILYLMVVLSYFTAMSREELLTSRAIGVTWAVEVLGPAQPIISIGVCLTALGSLNATFLSAGRLSSVAAKHGQMPDVASWVEVRSKTPLINVCIKAVLATIIISFATGQECIRFYIFCAWLFHGMSIVALIILRFKNKHKKRPYKVDLWIPVVVLVGIAYLLLAPFFQEPAPEFVVALVLIFLSLTLYYPVTWIKEKNILTVPDKLTIWLQLFLRVAPKRDLRRERRSMLRRMSILARDSLFITPSVQSPAMMRRFSRRMSRLSRFEGSPALVRRIADQQPLANLRRRSVNRGGSLAEADIIKTGRSNSMWALCSGNKASPAIIRKKPNRTTRSFNQADVKTLPSVPSLPILKNRFNTTPNAPEDSKPGALAPPISLQIPHQTVRPTPSPIPEESSGPESMQFYHAYNDTQSISSGTSNTVNDENDFEIVADFESDGGGEYEVLAHPSDAKRLSYDSKGILDDRIDNDKSSSESSDSENSNSGSHNNLQHTFFATLFGPSSNSDSSMDDEYDDSEDEDEIFRPLSMFYYSDDELDLETGDKVSDTKGERVSNADPSIEGASYRNLAFEIEVESKEPVLHGPEGDANQQNSPNRLRERTNIQSAKPQDQHNVPQQPHRPHRPPIKLLRFKSHSVDLPFYSPEN